jgi:hypothetical protein
LVEAALKAPPICTGVASGRQAAQNVRKITATGDQPAVS